jgi:hypothetical protein
MPWLPANTRRTEVVQPEDHVFFRMVDIYLDQHLVFMGRTEPGTLWKVVQISSFNRRKGRYENVPVVRRMGDFVNLRCIDGLGWRALTFSYLSYSALWRLEHTKSGSAT